MTFDFYEETMPIAISKANNQYNFVSIIQFREYLKVNSEVKFHQEGPALSGRLPDCDGFISFLHGFNVNNIIKEEELNNLIQYNDLLEQVIKEEWGEFRKAKENTHYSGWPRWDLPYTHIEKYKKI